MSVRWERRFEPDNRGNPLEIWFFGDYELSKNVNLGNEGGWVYELTLRGKRVGLHPTLAEGKRALSPSGSSADEIEQPAGAEETACPAP